MVLSLTELFGEIAAAANLGIPDVATVLSPDIDGLAMLLAMIRRAIRQLQDAAVFVEDELVKVMPGKTREVVGLGVIEMHTGAVRKGWDKEGLTQALIHVLAHELPDLINPETGEQINLVQMVERLVTMFTDAATPSWKVTGLRKYGIDPEDYCETSWGRKTIQTPTLQGKLEES